MALRQGNETWSPAWCPKQARKLTNQTIEETKLDLLPQSERGLTKSGASEAACEASEMVCEASEMPREASEMARGPS